MTIYNERIIEDAAIHAYRTVDFYIDNRRCTNYHTVS